MKIYPVILAVFFATTNLAADDELNANELPGDVLEISTVGRDAHKRHRTRLFTRRNLGLPRGQKITDALMPIDELAPVLQRTH